MTIITFISQKGGVGKSILNQTLAVEAKAVQKYLKNTGYARSPYYIMEKSSYKQIQNEGKSITQTKYERLAKQAKELISSLLDYKINYITKKI